MATNPISITRESKDAEIDQSIPKIILLGIFGVGLSVLITKLFLDFLSALTTGSFLLWFGAIAAFLIIVALEVLFVKSGGRLLLLALLQGIAPLAFFLPELYPRPFLPLLAGAAVFILLLILGMRRAWNVLQKSISIQFSLAVRSMFPKVVTGMLVFFTVVMYVFYFSLGRFSEPAAHTLFNGTLATAEPILKLWFPDAAFNQPASAFFENAARTGLEKIPLSALGQAASDQTVDFKSLPPAFQQKLLDEATQKLKSTFEAQYGPLPEGGTMGDALYALLKKYAGDVQATTGNMIWVIVAVAFFFIIRGFFTLTLWFVSFLAFLAYKFLVITGFAYTAVETRNREFLLLS